MHLVVRPTGRSIEVMQEHLRSSTSESDWGDMG